MRPASAHDRETVMPADPPARTPKPMIEASLRPCRGGPRLEISGELDISAHDYVRDCLNACSALSETIEVDLSRVTFIDIGGLRPFADAARAGRTLVLVSVSMAVADCLSGTRLQTLFQRPMT